MIDLLLIIIAAAALGFGLCVGYVIGRVVEAEARPVYPWDDSWGDGWEDGGLP